MADFGPAFDFLLPHEGGYVCDPEDLGGETRYGISKRSYPDVNLQCLTPAGAAAIYERDWWNRYPFAELCDQTVANKVFDMAVNMGTKEAFTLFQRAVCDCGEMVLCDGELGPVTLAAANRLDGVLLVEAIRREAAQFYLNLAAHKPSNAKFLKGWLVRANA